MEALERESLGLASELLHTAVDGGDLRCLERARNFGAIVGVGGASYSIDRAQVDALGHWIDEVLEPTPYPFMHRPAGTDAAAGKALYVEHCAGCHGQYESGPRADASATAPTIPDAARALHPGVSSPELRPGLLVTQRVSGHT